MTLLRYSLILFMLGFIAPTQAQVATHISGHSPELSGKTVYLYGYTDFISKRQVLLDSTTISNDGLFALDFSISEIRYVQLAAERIAAYMYVAPGTSYDIELPNPDLSIARSFGRKATTEVIFNNLELDDINAMIIDFNYNYETFFQNNYDLLNSLFSPRDYSAIVDTVAPPRIGVGGINLLFDNAERFGSLMDSVYHDWDNPYFALYRSSAIGDLMMNSPATQREIYDLYIAPYAFASQHPEFTRLYERFFKFYFARHAQSYGESDLNEVLNTSGDYEALKIMLAKDDFLSDPERMDVVISMATKEIWASNGLNHQQVAQLLTEIKEKGHSVLSKAIASHLRHRLTARKKGFAPIDVEFVDQYNETHSLSELQGKPMLIEFGADWCTRCDIENGHLSALEENYKGVLKVLHVEVDGNALDNSTKGTNKNDDLYTWVDSESDWIRDYQILSLPYYVLLDADGKVMMDSTPMPSEGLEATLFRLQSEGKLDKRQEIGGKGN